MRTFTILSASDICLALGARLRCFRLEHNLSQTQLADMTATSLSSIRRLEASGQGSIELLVRVSQALHVSSQWDNLFAMRIESIADAERAETPLRKRARTAATARK